VLKNDPDNAPSPTTSSAWHSTNWPTPTARKRSGAMRFALRPDIVEAHRALAGVAIHRGDPGALAQEADQIIALQPAAPDGYLLRGSRRDRSQTVRHRRRVPSQVDCKRKLPNNPAAYVQLGNLQMAQSQYAEAQKFYQQALDQDPNSTEALGGVLNVDLIQKQPDRAIAGARAQLAKFPKNAGFHIMLGQLLLEQAKDLPDRRSRSSNKPSTWTRNNSEAMVKLGVVQNLRGASDQALQTFPMARKSIPTKSVSTCWPVASTRASRIGIMPSSSTRKRLKFSPTIRWPRTTWPT
jgi:tetratricopeptide (TPR) repeat protein